MAIRILVLLAVASFASSSHALVGPYVSEVRPLVETTIAGVAGDRKIMFPMKAAGVGRYASASKWFRGAVSLNPWSVAATVAVSAGMMAGEEYLGAWMEDRRWRAEGTPLEGGRIVEDSDGDPDQSHWIMSKTENFGGTETHYTLDPTIYEDQAAAAAAADDWCAAAGELITCDRYNSAPPADMVNFETWGGEMGRRMYLPARDPVGNYFANNSQAYNASFGWAQTHPSTLPDSTYWSGNIWVNPACYGYYVTYYNIRNPGGPPYTYRQEDLQRWYYPAYSCSREECVQQYSETTGECREDDPVIERYFLYPVEGTVFPTVTEEVAMAEFKSALETALTNTNADAIAALRTATQRIENIINQYLRDGTISSGISDHVTTQQMEDIAQQLQASIPAAIAAELADTEDIDSHPDPESETEIDPDTQTAIDRAVDREEDQVPSHSETDPLLPEKRSLTTVLEWFWDGLGGLPMVSFLEDMEITLTGVSPVLDIGVPTGFSGGSGLAGHDFSPHAASFALIGNILLALVTITEAIYLFRG